jgi:protein arginine kinase activator
MATFLVTQVINNQETEVYLCSECASLGNSVNLGLSSIFDDLVSNIIGFDSNTRRKNIEEVNDIKLCEKCGMSYKEFEKTGKIGCENCYKTFGEMFTPVIKKIQKNVKHTGKFPEKMKEKIILDKEIEKLKSELNEAVSKEEYEKAADIRDKIKKIKGEEIS